MHLDTVCTMVDTDKIVMYPNVADHLQAYAVTPAGSGEEARDLERKLPAELFEETDAARPTDPERLRVLLDEARDLLLARLLATPEALES